MTWWLLERRKEDRLETYLGGFGLAYYVALRA